MKNKILIITGGDIDNIFLKEHMLKENYSLIIVADSGLEAVDRLGIKVDHIVGDFDSVSQDLLEKYNKTSVEIHRFSKEKDKTDTEIAIGLALMQDPARIDIIGAIGSRVDHTVANINLLLLPLGKGIEANILDANNRIYLKDKGFTIDKASQFGKYISLIAFFGPVEDLILKGFKYPLDGIKLDFASSLGISNEIVDERAIVEFSRGILLVVEALD